MVLSPQHIHQELTQLIGASYASLTYGICISGGVDSVVLAHLFHVSKLSFVLIHVNYGLRAEESDKDTELIEQFAKELGKKRYIKRADISQKQSSDSIQSWAREERYIFAQDIAQREGIDYVVTAHHADDAIESVWLHTIRGKGWESIKGIVPVNQNIIRPLLGVPKKEIYQYAQSNSLKWREDASNQKNDYQRNIIRNTLIPALEELDRDYRLGFMKLIQEGQLLEEFIETYLLKLNQEIIHQETEKTLINYIKLSEESQFIQYEFLKQFGFLSYQEQKKIGNAQAGSIFQSKQGTLFIASNNWYFVRNDLSISPKKISSWEQWEFEDDTWNIQTKVSQTPQEDALFWLDKDKITLPIIIRPKQTGDIFQPYGMKGNKKVSKFMKDEKMSIFEKNNTAVWTHQKGDILAVGNRVDQNYAIQSQTLNIINVYEKDS